MNSPQSQNDTVGAIVFRYRTSAMRKTRIPTSRWRNAKMGEEEVGSVIYFQRLVNQFPEGFYAQGFEDDTVKSMALYFGGFHVS